MFCPKCATQNLEGASYCRVCGANISLVSQALSGQLPQVEESNCFEIGRTRRQGRQRREPTLEHAIKNVFMGIGFFLVAIALSFSIGRGWWFWMLIPAFSMMGTGVAHYIRLKNQQKQTFKRSAMVQSALHATPGVNSFPTRNTEEIAPPPSVTEGTTRHLGIETHTGHFDASTERPK